MTCTARSPFSVRVALLAVSVLVGACEPGMQDQERVEALEAHPDLPRAALLGLAPPGTVAAEQGDPDRALSARTAEGRFRAAFPVAPTDALVERGASLHGIHCAPCHGRQGRGDGIVVERGFPAPASYATPELRDAPPGRLVEAISNGYGVMFPFESRIAPRDRWAIAAWIQRAAAELESSGADGVEGR